MARAKGEEGQALLPGASPHAATQQLHQLQQQQQQQQQQLHQQQQHPPQHQQQQGTALSNSEFTTAFTWD